MDIISDNLLKGTASILDGYYNEYQYMTPYVKIPVALSIGLAAFGYVCGVTLQFFKYTCRL